MKVEVVKDYRPYMILMADDDGYAEEPLYGVGPFANKAEAIAYAVKHIDRYRLVALNDPADGLPVTYLHKGDNDGVTGTRVSISRTTS